MQPSARTRASVEVGLWLYTRLSALGMLVLVMGHLAVMHLTDIRHTLGVDVVRDRLAAPFWLAFDVLLLVLAVTHGVLGARGVAVDHVAGTRGRAVVTWCCVVVTVIFVVLGTIVLIGLSG